MSQCSTNSLKLVRKKFNPNHTWWVCEIGNVSRQCFSGACKNPFWVSAWEFIPEPIKQVMRDPDCQEPVDLEHPQCITDPAVSSSRAYVCSSASWICWISWMRTTGVSTCQVMKRTVLCSLTGLAACPGFWGIWAAVQIWWDWAFQYLHSRQSLLMLWNWTLSPRFDLKKGVGEGNPFSMKLVWNSTSEVLHVMEFAYSD